MNQVSLESYSSQGQQFLMATGMLQRQMQKSSMKKVFLGQVICLKFHQKILIRNFINFVGDAKILLFEVE